MTKKTESSSPKKSSLITSNQPYLFSLLWPSGSAHDAGLGQSLLSQSAWHDLALNNVAIALSTDQEHQREVAKILATLIQDPAVIQYRQDVLDDLIRNPILADRLEKLMPAIDALGRYAYHAAEDSNTLHEITYRLGELQSIIDCIQGLGEVLSEVEAAITSQGFRSFFAEIKKVQEDPVFRNLVDELPELLARVRTCASVTIGVNLDQFLRPVEATLLSVNDEKFTSQSMLTRLFGKQGDSMEGIAPLHTVPTRVVTDSPVALPVSSELGWAVDPMMVPLFADLAKVIEKTTRPVVRQLKHFTEITSRMFVNLRQDFVFYLGALRFIQKIQGYGLPMCRPTLVAAEAKLCEVEDSYNANLALQKGYAVNGTNPAAITQNDIQIGPQGRILILTGPNQGGKTTYMQGVGILQVLAQVGLYVPGTQARISPVDNIYTHFPLEEKPESEAGRFGEEAKRLGEIFQQVTRHSLVLLNESLSSTSAGESFYIAQDVVRILRRMGARAIYSTHLHELAEQAEALNESTPGTSRIVSIVSSPVDEHQIASTNTERTFTIEARPPLGRSYAREIAACHGISYEQLEKTMAERGQLPN